MGLAERCWRASASIACERCSAGSCARQPATSRLPLHEGAEHRQRVLSAPGKGCRQGDGLECGLLVLRVGVGKDLGEALLDGHVAVSSPDDVPPLVVVAPVIGRATGILASGHGAELGVEVDGFRKAVRRVAHREMVQVRDEEGPQVIIVLAIAQDLDEEGNGGGARLPPRPLMEDVSPERPLDPLADRVSLALRPALEFARRGRGIRQRAQQARDVAGHSIGVLERAPVDVVEAVGQRHGRPR